MNKMRTFGYMLACEKVCYFLFNIFCKKTKKKTLQNRSKDYLKVIDLLLSYPEILQAGVMDLFMGKD